MSLGPIGEGPKFLPINKMSFDPQQKIPPDLQKLLDELADLEEPLNHDLGDGKTPNSFSWLADLKHPTPEQKKMLEEKFQDVKHDLQKIKAFLNKPGNQKLMKELGQINGWTGQGSGFDANSVSSTLQSFNNLFEMFNQPHYQSGLTGSVDMMVSDLTYLHQMITQKKPM